MSADAASSPSFSPLARNGSFHLLWSSTFVSGFGDRLAMFAVLTMMGMGTGRGNDASLQGGIDFFFFLPYLLWAPIAGWLADRLPRKWLLFAADESRGLVVLALALLVLPLEGSTQLPEDKHWLGWLMMLLIGVGAATFSPVKISIVPNVVGSAQLQRANSVVINLGIIGNLLGAVVGGTLAGDVVRPCIVMSAGAYILSGLVWPFLKAPQHFAHKPPSLTASLNQLRDGVGYVWMHRPIKLLTLLSMLIWAGTSVYIPALAALSTEDYGGGPQTFSLMLGFLGLGMLLGGAVMGLANSRLETSFIIVLGTLGTGLGLALQVLIPSQAIGIVMVILTGFSAGLMLVAINTLVQRISADYVRGRVFGAREMLSEVGKVAASFSIWMLPQSNALMKPLTVGMGTAMVVVALWGFKRFVLDGPAPTSGLNLLWRFTRLYADAVHHLKVTGRHLVPKRGPVLLVSNHTAGLDPLLIQAASMRVVRWMMAAEYIKPYLNFLWKRTNPIGVNRFARDPRSLRAAIDHLRADGALGVFPEGSINREGGELKRISPGVGVIALSSDARVVPIHISGTPRTESAMASYLFPSNARLIFGEPFTVPAEFDRDQATALIRQKLEALRLSVV